MQELLRKIGRFCENHVEKLVLVVACLVCAYLFFTRVIFSPYVVEYDGQTFSPGRIDKYIQAKAQDLAAPAPGNTGSDQTIPYTSRVDGPVDPNDPVVADVFVGRPKPRSFRELIESPLAFMSPKSLVASTSPQRQRSLSLSTPANSEPYPKPLSLELHLAHRLRSRQPNGSRLSGPRKRRGDRSAANRLQNG